MTATRTQRKALSLIRYVSLQIRLNIAFSLTFKFTKEIYVKGKFSKKALIRTSDEQSRKVCTRNTSSTIEGQTSFHMRDL